MFRRRPKDPAAEAAQQRLTEAVAELERTRQAASDQVKAARDPFEQEIKRYTRRVSDAEESVDRAFEDRKVATLPAATPSLVLRETTLKIGDRIRPITPDLKASVDSEGNLATKSRMTLTRIGLGGAVAGPLGAVVGAGAQKGVELDKRALYLLFEADAWAVVSQCDPDRGKAAREFVQQVNVAARQVTTVRERQLHTARGAHEVLAAASADREAMSELAATFDETRADAIAHVEAARAPVSAALEAIDDGGRPARKARKQLDKPPIDDKLIAPIELPASPEVIDPSEVHSGAADVERLASAISGFVRRVNPGLEKLAAAVSPDEESLVVAVTQGAALLVTNRRLIVADAEGVQSVNRADVLTVDQAGFLGGVKVETRGQGELAWSTLRPKNVDEDIRALLAEPVELAEQPAAEQPAELPPVAQTPDTPGIEAPAGEDVIEQIRRLGELRDAGVLTEAEFDSKKEELLRRV